MAKKLFTEKQRFRSYETLILLVSISFALLVKIVMGVGQLEMQTLTMLALLFISVSGLIWVLTQMELRMSVSKKHLRFRFFSPIYKRKGKIALKNIRCSEIVKTSLAAQWSGANICFRRCETYSFNGRNGVFIETKDGSAFFIGSQKIKLLKDALEEVLHREGKEEL